MKLTLALVLIFGSLSAQAQSRGTGARGGVTTQAARENSQGTEAQSSQLNNGAKPAALSLGAARRARSTFAQERTFTAQTLDLANLESLIGTEISYTGAYAPNDPADDRRISGKGTVFRVAYWGRDAIKTFSIIFLNKDGILFNTQIAITDKTFKLKSNGLSPVPALKAKALNDGLKVTMANYGSSDIMFASVLSKLPSDNVRIAYFDRATTPPSLKEFDATSMVIPTDAELILGPLEGKYPFFEFKNAEGSVKIKTVDIVMIAAP